MKILRKLILTSGFILFCLQHFANGYEYFVDLVNMKDDKIKVELTCPEIPENNLKFNFPMTVPGTYDILNFGKYITDLQAFDEEGNQVKHKKSGHNSFVFKEATRIEKITYWVDDTWDSGVKKNKIFQPAGTGFEDDTYFVINNSGLFGYFDGIEKVKYQLTFLKPKELTGFTSLKRTEIDHRLEQFTAPDYHKLIDCPLMFSKPDTVTFQVSQCKVTISAYHESGEKVARKIYNEIKPSMEAIEKFLGKIPVDNYTFLFYIKDSKKEMEEILAKPGIGAVVKLGRFGDLGALEHGNSSFYYLVDVGDNLKTPHLEDLNYLNFTKSVAVHEFMHIITPLNLHSKEIGEFNYIEPKMSKHLWLYEGVTEYFAGIILLRDSIYNLNTYLYEELKPKIEQAEKFPSHKMSFTEMSENVLKRKYQKQYIHVYDRGAILALLLDIEIMKLTQGEKSLRDVVLELCERYGQSKSFDDEEIINEIVSITHPDLKQFFTKYIEGTQPLPLQEGLKNLGIYYAPEEMVAKPIFTDPINGIVKNKTKTIELVLTGNFEVKEVNHDSRFRKGDILNWYNIQDQLYKDYTIAVEKGDTIYIDVIRNNENLLLPIIVGKRETKGKNVLRQFDPLSDNQQFLLNTWLYNNGYPRSEKSMSSK